MTIPKALRDRLGIRPGQILEFEAEEGCLVACKVSTGDSVASVFGILELGEGTDAVIERLRGEPDAL